MARLINVDDLKTDLIRYYPPETLAGMTAETLFKQILTDIDNAVAVKQNDIVFLCDKTIKCSKNSDCGVICKHTHDIEHAVNFERLANVNGNIYYYEKDAKQ